MPAAVSRFSSYLSTLSLVCLCLQNAAVALITRESRVNPVRDQSTGAAVAYHTSTVILLNEVTKLVICLVVFGFERKSDRASWDVAEYGRALKEAVVQKDTLLLAVPAALFCLQNFLIFVSLGSLNVVLFQTLSQSKLIFSALFATMLMGRRLSRMQWVAIVALTCGVVLAHADSGGTVAFIAKHLPRFWSNDQSVDQKHPQQPNAASDAAVVVTSGATVRQQAAALLEFSYTGVLACLISALSSSFAGVYFELIVKSSAPSLSVRNIHLSLFGIPLALLSMCVLDVWREGVRNFEFFRGFSPTVWLLVLTHAVGGLLVAAVVKYADNIAKGFATAAAVLLTGAYSAVFWSFSPTLEFVLGCAAVFASAIMYQVYEIVPATVSASTAGIKKGDTGSAAGDANDEVHPLLITTGKT